MIENREEIAAGIHAILEKAARTDIDRIEDRGEYAVICMWLHGFSILTIKKAMWNSHHWFSMNSDMKLTEGAVQSVCRSQTTGGRYMPKNRGDMSIQERQALLDRLKQNRLDDGILPDWCFRAIELRKKNQKRA